MKADSINGASAYKQRSIFHPYRLLVGTKFATEISPLSPSLTSYARNQITLETGLSQNKVLPLIQPLI